MSKRKSAAEQAADRIIGHLVKYIDAMHRTAGVPVLGDDCEARRHFEAFLSACEGTGPDILQPGDKLFSPLLPEAIRRRTSIAAKSKGHSEKREQGFAIMREMKGTKRAAIINEVMRLAGASERTADRWWAQLKKIDCQR